MGVSLLPLCAFSDLPSSKAIHVREAKENNTKQKIEKLSNKATSVCLTVCCFIYRIRLRYNAVLLHPVRIFHPDNE